MDVVSEGRSLQLKPAARDQKICGARNASRQEESSLPDYPAVGGASWLGAVETLGRPESHSEQFPSRGDLQLKSGHDLKSLQITHFFTLGS